MRTIKAITGNCPLLYSVFIVACLSIWAIGNARASSLVPQTHLDGSCIPKFSVPLPVFGPAGSIPRVDAFAHRKLKGSRYFCERFLGVLPKNQQTDVNHFNAFGCPSRPGHSLATQQGVSSHALQ